ncbi:MAG TPA: preprotein translocase subunit YajC [Spirochaetia bacterium]|jgi:preprotein translocase subunit YajC|nr:preprotein translocase subunit YajC [Spirochaetia bacterium]
MDALTSILTFLQAAGAEQGGQSLIMTGVTFGLVILIFYFLIIRPQNKKQKDTEKMLSAIKKGDKVYTIGGLHGVVHSTNEEKATVTLKVDEGSSTTLEFNKSAIAGLVNPPVAKKDDKKEKEDKKAAKAADAAAAVEKK